jgi:hypothetical protein
VVIVVGVVEKVVLGVKVYHTIGVGGRVAVIGCGEGESAIFEAMELLELQELARVFLVNVSLPCQLFVLFSSIFNNVEN